MRGQVIEDLQLVSKYSVPCGGAFDGSEDRDGYIATFTLDDQTNIDIECVEAGDCLLGMNVLADYALEMRNSTHLKLTGIRE